MLKPGERVPHFEVRDLRGQSISYKTIWQARRLVLVALPSQQSQADESFLTRWNGLASALDPQTAVVITRDPVQGVDAPGVVIADEWGEVFYASSAADLDGLPHAQECIDWVHFIRSKCPECEGEAR